IGTANSANTILRLNGRNLKVYGATFTNNQTTVNSQGLDASVTGSKLTFSGNISQVIALGNQTFGNVPTAPDMEISNTFAASGAAIGTAGTYYVRNLKVNSGGFLNIGNGAAVTLNILGTTAGTGTDAI